MGGEVGLHRQGAGNQLRGKRLRSASGRYALALGVCALFAAFLAPLPLAAQGPDAKAAPPKAVDGRIDLTGWDLDTRGPLALDGTWLLEWHRFSVSGAAGSQGAGSSPTLPAKVPSIWNSYRIPTGGDDTGVSPGGAQSLPAFGFGTFRLHVVLPRLYPSISLELSGVCTSYELYVNGKKLESSGRIAADAAGQIPMVTDRVVTFAPASRRLDIDIEVSNYVHRVGGLTHPIYLGTGTALVERHARGRELDFLLIGAFAVMGLYHLALFLLRRQEHSLLYFGIFCLLTVVRIYVTSAYSEPPFGGGVSWHWLMRIEYMTLTIGFPVFLLYVHALYRKEFHRRVRDVIIALSGLYTILVLIAPAIVYGRLLILFQAVILASSAYVYWVLFRAIKRRRSSAKIFIAGYTIFFLGVFNDILVNNRLIGTGYIFPIALFAFIFFQAVLLGTRFARVYRQVEYLTRLQSQLRTANQSLRELSYVDSLTSVANRRHFDEFIRQEWARGVRNKTPLSLLMVDIDSFKSYNDNYGHQAGDEALRRVAAELSRAVRRQVDFLARYGGEEFVVVLPNTTAKGATRVAEKLRSSVQALHIPHAYSGVASVLTISIGVASEQPNELGPIGHLVDSADRALYRAKQRGKNCVASL